MPANLRPILSGRVNFPLCLAPMVGLSHVGLRLLVRRYLPAGAFTIWPTEMLNSRRIPREVLGSTPETMKDDAEDGLVPQILGNDEVSIRETVKKLEAWGAVGIDINMGCPVAKALRHNYGVALMGDSDYASQVVRMTVKASQVPVSVKLRAGLQNDFGYLKNFVQGLEDAGASWICLHPRVAEQKRRGNADWSQIRAVREGLKIPVIGNGDIQTAEDVFQMLNETTCDLVMAGRALTARPWLFWQVGKRLGLPNPPGLEGLPPESAEEEGQEFGLNLLLLIGHFRRYFNEGIGLRKFMFYIKNSYPWLEFGHALFASLSRAQSYDDLQSRVLQFFSVPQRMHQRTDLRY